MLARLQQFSTVTQLAAALVCLLWLGLAGHALWAVSGVLFILFGYALVLALEFVLLRMMHGSDTTPRATPRQLLRAWWFEVCAAALVFSWRQPFRSQLWPDHLPANAQGLRGVLLVHGFVCNRGLWNPWLQRLTKAGVPFVAVNLEPVFSSIDEYVQPLELAVQQLENATGCPPVVVAHSMGGLAVRRWLIDCESGQRMHHTITIGTPHHGTWLARFALSRNARQMRQCSAWLAALERRELPGHADRFTCFYGHCDNIVFPPATAMLAGADNRHLSATAHVHMASRSEPFNELMRRLET